MIRIDVLLCALAFVLPNAVSANSTVVTRGLDANEIAMVAWSKAHAEEAIDLIEQLVNINSGSLNLQGVREVVVRNLPLTDVSISFTEGYPAMAPTPGNRALRDQLSAINQALGREAMPVLDPSRRGAADISFVAPYTDGLAGMGPYGEGGHTPRESLDLDSIPIAIQRAAILIYQLSR